MYFSEIKNGIEEKITSTEFNARIAKYKTYIKKNRDEWKKQGFTVVLISRVFKTEKKTRGGIIEIRPFTSLFKLEKYTGSGIFNIFYLD